MWEDKDSFQRAVITEPRFVQLSLQSQNGNQLGPVVVFGSWLVPISLRIPGALEVGVSQRLLREALV